ncbi:A/G-specific adenine glycosylase [Candidatus Parcubacteria bacterium]|nr:MAG: A/G-specific adenine glycosylase [Candidatus Parcubacteria bacterium]
MSSRGKIQRGRGNAVRIQEVRAVVWRYYRAKGRKLPWRVTHNPYRIFVSEIMLQQTQVERVLKKYPQFLRAFPSWESLARAPLAKVLAVWQGMGYNRRALALRASARRVLDEYGGKLPRDYDALRSLPGVGPATAGALSAFIFQLPVPFLETNIRRALLYFFFRRTRNKVGERELLECAAAVLDRKNPREWHYALMDYGAMLRKETPSLNRKSEYYRRQAPFRGSLRELRGKIIARVLRGAASAAQLQKETGRTREDVARALVALLREGLITKKGGYYFPPEGN